MKIKIRFGAGEPRLFGTDKGYGVNYMTLEMLDKETAQWAETMEAENEDFDFDDFYVETGVSVSPDDDEYDEIEGYDDMADELAERFRKLGVDLKDVEWWYGSREDGSPRHYGEK